MGDTVQYDGAARPGPTTLADAEPIPAGDVNPWDAHEHEWLELYRYFPFLQYDPETGDAIEHDTAEPPRGEPDEKTGAGAAKTRMGEGFDVDEHGADHYTTTDPGAEIVFQCQRCLHTEPVKVPAAAYKRLLQRVEAGELGVEQFSQYGHEELLGAALTPKTGKLAKPEIPGWLEEQRQMIRRRQAGLPAVPE